MAEDKTIINFFIYIPPLSVSAVPKHRSLNLQLKNQPIPFLRIRHIKARPISNYIIP